ncbi:hypothetical protein GCM10007874_48870 [Labrys miyagiensis]|uniref:Uncharacterized protein n=1 Tax=Labrys miyagiensis TaxID=346912 RepID=A0ABQ6CPW8_9HYPH|nr:hypothetical protein GCM10007874_48870 [Labrys miyagiensis]
MDQELREKEHLFSDASSGTALLVVLEAEPDCRQSLVKQVGKVWRAHQIVSEVRIESIPRGSQGTSIRPFVGAEIGGSI